MGSHHRANINPPIRASARFLLQEVNYMKCSECGADIKMPEWLEKALDELDAKVELLKLNAKAIESSRGRQH